MEPETIVVPAGRFDSGTVIRPGDKLVFCTPERLTMKMADEFKSRLNERLPGVEVVIIDNTSHFAVYRPEPIVVHVDGLLTEGGAKAMIEHIKAAVRKRPPGTRTLG